MSKPSSTPGGRNKPSEAAGAVGKGTLRITTEPSPLAVLVSDPQYNVVAQGVSPLNVELAPGLYVVRASRVGHPDLTNFASVISKGERSVHLGISDPSLAQVASGVATDLFNKLRSLVGKAIVPPLQEEKVFWIRFLRLKDWNTSELLEPLPFSSEYVEGRAILDITNKHRSVVFAQLARKPGAVLNVALPPAGTQPVRCQLIVDATAKLVCAHVRLSTDWANAAMQYMAQGYVDQAKAVIEAGQKPSDVKPSIIGRIIGHVTRRFEDPSVALVPRYLRLRMGDTTIFSTLKDAFLDVFQESIPDGKIISAEIAARQGEFAQSAQYLAEIETGRLPLFTEGYSLLIHRLRELIDLDPATPEINRPKRAKVEKLKELLRSLKKWAPYLDLNRPTLTFRGQDVTAPATNEEALTPTEKEGWVRGPEPPASA